MNQRRSKFPITQNSFRDLRKTKRRVWTPDSLQIYWFDLYKEMTLQHFLNTEWALLSLFQSRPSICFIFFISPLSFIINQMDPFVTRESIHAYSKNWSLVYNSIYAEKSSTTIPINTWFNQTFTFSEFPQFFWSSLLCGFHLFQFKYLAWFGLFNAV